jgi:hypothetical protein
LTIGLHEQLDTKMTAYQQGFIDKCADLGVDPGVLVTKQAKPLLAGGSKLLKLLSGAKQRQANRVMWNLTRPGMPVTPRLNRVKAMQNTIADRTGLMRGLGASAAGIGLVTALRQAKSK